MTNWIVGINKDDWPAAYPLSWVSSIMVDPRDGDAVLEFSANTRAETLSDWGIVRQDELSMQLRSLEMQARKGKT